MKKYKQALCAVAGVCLAMAGGVAAAPSERIDYTPPAQVGITGETDEQYVAQYEKVEENGRLIFYADFQKGWLALQNRDNGTVWYSTPNNSEADEITTGSRRMDVRSDLIVEYYDTQSVGEAVSMTFNSHTQAVRQGGVQVQRISGGIRVTYTFEAFGMVIPVEYRLLEDCLETRVCVEEIEETASFTILSIRVLPNFGAGDSHTEGWMLIPDGSGAVARFNHGRYNVNGYEAPVYGRDYANEQELRQPYKEQAVRLPVFGIGKGEDALFAAITQGEGAASIQAEFSDASFGYNTLSSRLTLRTFTTIDVNNMKATRVSDNGYSLPDYIVRYYLLSGEEADYAGMANTYRQYLIAERGMKKTALAPALNLHVYGAIDIKTNTLGFPHQKLTGLTSFSQARDMAAYLQTAGAGVLSMRYEGWANYGVFNKTVPKNAEPLPLLGGQTEIKQLAAALEGTGGQLWPDVDLLRFRQGGGGISKGGDSIKNGFGDPTEQYDYMLSVYAAKVSGNHYHFLRADKVREVAGRITADFKKQGFSCLSLGTMGEYVYSDLNPGQGHGRTGLLQAYRQIQESLDGRPLAVSGGNADTAVHAAKIWEAPVSSSGYDCFDYDVPFYQMVFHGYAALTTPPLNQIVNDRLLFLNAVETGSELLFAGIHEDAGFLAETAYSGLYSTTFSLWKEKAAAYDKEYRPLLERIYNQAIVSHGCVAEEVYRTVFEDGTAVYVNYGTESRTVDGVEIGGMDFASSIP